MDQQSGKREVRIKAFFPFVMLSATLIFIGGLFMFLIFKEAGKLPTEGLLGKLFSSNTMVYLGSLVLLAVAMLLLRFISRFIPEKITGFMDKLLPVWLQKILVVVLTAVPVIFLTRRFFMSELTEFGATPSTFWNHRVGFGTIVILSVLFAALGIVFTRIRLSKWIVYICYGLSIVLTYYTVLFTDPFAIDYHHSTAYIESIINAYKGVPYDIITTGIYGHYGIIYAPFMHIFGGTPDVIFCMIALFSAIADICLIYVVHNITESNFMRIVTVFASQLTISVLRPHFYWQVQPHRILFPIVIVAYLTYMIKHRKQFVHKFIPELIGYVVCAMSFVWNTETGLFCIAGFVVSMLCIKLQEVRWCTKEFFVVLFKNVCMGLGAVVLALLTVNIYNLACGGSLIIKDYFYPLFESGYIDAALAYDMEIDNRAWIYTLLLFVILLFRGLYETSLFTVAERSPLSPVMVCTALIGMLNFSYYANRAAYFNLDIIIYPACVGILLLFESFKPCLERIRTDRQSVKKVFKASMSALSYLVLVTMASQIIFVKPVIEDRIAIGQYESNGIQKYADVISSYVPKDTFAFGTGANMVYLQLGWESGGYYRDYSDFYVSGTEVEEKLIEDALEHDEFVNFGTSVTIKILEKDPRYRMVRTENLGRIPAEYFSRIYDNLEQFTETVSPNSYVFGRNISGLCSAAEWDKQNYFDTKNAEEGMDITSAIIDSALEHNSFVSVSGYENEEAVLAELTKPEYGYVLLSEFDVSEFKISYYVKWTELVTVEEVYDTVSDVTISGDYVTDIFGACNGKIQPNTDLQIDIEIEAPVQAENAQLFVDLYGGPSYDQPETEKDLLTALSNLTSYSLLLNTRDFDPSSCECEPYLRIVAVTKEPVVIKNLTISRVTVSY